MNDGAHQQLNEHEEFVELCALYASGSLADEQVRTLEEHLEVCAECRTVLQEFQELESMGLPAVAPDLADLGESIAHNGKLDEATNLELLGRIEDEIRVRSSSGRDAAPVSGAQKEAEKSEEANPPIWMHAATYARTVLAVAAAICVAGALSVYSYHLGAKKVRDVSGEMLKRAETQEDALQSQITTLSADRAALDAQLEGSNRKIEDLTARITSQIREIAALTDEKRSFEDLAQRADANKQASDSDRDQVNHKLQDAQFALSAMQKKLDAAREEQANVSLRAASLEKRLSELSTSTKDRDDTIQQQRDLLSHDRDIRDLIGARDLYVAEVTDVGRDGQTKKPFGRVFFTKGKSLIFYAYDLDHQPGLHRASTFQAWGRLATNFDQALPLGILYLDSSSNKRWVLKFDDPKTLAKIDGLFVTVEPPGGSQKPSSKPLLFAYLKVEPNHP